MKLLFIYDLVPALALHWKDGLWAALKELEKDWEIEYFNLAKDNATDYMKEYDFKLGWGGASSIVAQLPLDGLCFGGGDINSTVLDKFKVVFVENDEHLIKPNFRLAFGTNTDLFRPIPQQPKLLDAIYPAGFATWKHQEVFADICNKEGLRGLAVGYMQPDNQQETMDLTFSCVSNGVAVMDTIPMESLVYLYNMSKEVIITADSSGGCERSILEAKACGIPVRVVGNSKKLQVLNKLTHEDVVKYWNHIEYARKLKFGIEESSLVATAIK